MTKQSEIEAPRMYPTMRCRDAEAMITWLKDVVGFTERVVYRNGGMVQHAELAYGPSLLMLGQSRDDEYGKLAGDACRDPEGNLWSFGTYRPKANEKPL